VKKFTLEYVVMLKDKKVFFLVVIGFLLILFLYYSTKSISVFNPSFEKKAQRLVVIDPGHGGFDPGAVYDGVKESEINLQIAKRLKEYLEMFSFKVLLTRYDSDDLSESDNKFSDLKKRKEIVLKNNPDLFISIHLNSFSVGKYFGAQVFYDKANSEGERFAYFVQNELRHMPNGMYNKRQIKNIDVYILRNLKMPSILIECGFMSNKTELMLLKTPEYQHWLAYSIVKGTLRYFDEVKGDEL